MFSVVRNFFFLTFPVSVWIPIDFSIQTLIVLTYILDLRNLQKQVKKHSVSKIVLILHLKWSQKRFLDHNFCSQRVKQYHFLHFLNKMAKNWSPTLLTHFEDEKSYYPFHPTHFLKIVIYFMGHIEIRHAGKS